IHRKSGGIPDDDLSLIRSIQLLQRLVRADREILMERSDSRAKHSRLVDLERQRHPGVKIVVVGKVLLDLVPQAGRNQKVFRQRNVCLKEGAELELAHFDQRITQILREQERRSGLVARDVSECVCPQEVRLAEQAISVVITLSSRL